MTDDNKSSGSKAVLLSNNRRETAILRLFKYIISKLPDSFTITDDELIYSVECLCVTRPWARKAKTKTEGDKWLENKEFHIEISELYSRPITVVAQDKELAMTLIKQEYNLGHIILDKSDCKEIKFNLLLIDE